MPAPASITHQGQIPIEIDHAYRPEVVAFSRRLTTPTAVKKSAGAVSKTFGIQDVSGSVTCMVPAAGFGGMLALTDFTLSYPWGGSKYLIQHCSWNEDDRSVQPAAGDSTQTLNFTGVAEIEI